MAFDSPTILVICICINVLVCNVGSSSVAARDQSIATPKEVDTRYSKMERMLENLEERLAEAERALEERDVHDRRRRNVADTQSLPPEMVDGAMLYRTYYSSECFHCSSGQPGPQGPPGGEGPSGRDGTNGRDGMNGRDGRDHQYEPTECRSDTVSPPLRDESPGVNASLVPSAIYTRWGRRDCPETAELVYDGITGGAKYNEKGGGANFICLPHEPIYDVTESSVHANRGKIYSTELYGNQFPPFQQFYDGGDDIACAVCRVTSRSTVLMVPARNICPGTDWTLEYTGYLSASRHDVVRSEYVCVDRIPQAVSRSAHYQNGAWLHPVEGICLAGSGLPCGPYVDGYELTCAVCTI